MSSSTPGRSRAPRVQSFGTNSRRGNSSAKRGGAEVYPAVESAGVTKVRAPTAAAPTLPAHLQMVSEDVTSTLTAWAQQAERVYGRSSPAGRVEVTVLAATGVSKVVKQGCWVASVAGVTDETGPSVPLGKAVMQAPAGAPSWSEETLTLSVHDVTADLMLLLCEGATHGCVGRAILPLSELLPVMPFGVQPAARQLWVDILPPSAAHAHGRVDTTYEAARLNVPGSGMLKPPQNGRVLIKVALKLERTLLSAYLNVPAFQPTAATSGDVVGGEGGTADRPPVTPARVLTLASRVSALSQIKPPACLRLIAIRPLSSGGAVLVLTGWLCFFGSAPMFPWWLLMVWVVNGCSIRALATSPSPWEDTDDEIDEDGGTAEEQLEGLVEALLPVLQSLEAKVSAVEKLLTAPAFIDPHASFLAALPVLCLVAILSLIGWGIGAFVMTVGGAANAIFGTVAVCVLFNMFSYYRNELFDAWKGDEPGGGYGGYGGGSNRRAAAAFGPGSAYKRSARQGAPDEEDEAWLDSERKDVLAGWCCLGGLAERMGHVWSRLPDVPLEDHRTLAMAATASADGLRKGRAGTSCCPCACPCP